MTSLVNLSRSPHRRFEVHLQSAFYADKVKQLAISLRSGQYFYGLRGPRGAPFVQAGRWSKHTFYRSENTADYTDKVCGPLGFDADV